MSNPMTTDEQVAMTKVSASIQEGEDYYTVGLPWRDDMPPLPDSKQMAMHRLVHTEKRLLRNRLLRKYLFLCTSYTITM